MQCENKIIKIHFSHCGFVHYVLLGNNCHRVASLAAQTGFEMKSRVKLRSWALRRKRRLLTVLWPLISFTHVYFMFFSF
jgi:hypothetical protein